MTDDLSNGNLHFGGFPAGHDWSRIGELESGALVPGSGHEWFFRTCQISWEDTQKITFNHEILRPYSTNQITPYGLVMKKNQKAAMRKSSLSHCGPAEQVTCKHPWYGSRFMALKAQSLAICSPNPFVGTMFRPTQIHKHQKINTREVKSSSSVSTFAKNFDLALLSRWDKIVQRMGVGTHRNGFSPSTCSE